MRKTNGKQRSTGKIIVFTENSIFFNCSVLSFLISLVTLINMYHHNQQIVTGKVLLLVFQVFISISLSQLFLFFFFSVLQA